MDKKEFIESLKSLGEKRALSSEAESTLSQFKDLNMRFELEFVSYEKTFGSQYGSNYDGGYSVKCKAKDEGVELLVLFSTKSNERIESLNVGDLIDEEIKYLSFDNLYQKPIMGELVSSQVDLVQEVEEESEKETQTESPYIPPISQENAEPTFPDEKIAEEAQSVPAPTQYTQPVSNDNFITPSPVASIPQMHQKSGGSFGKKFFLILLVVLVCGGAFFLVNKMSSSSGKTKISAREVGTNNSGREFTRIYSINGVDILEAKLVYLGKSPKLPFVGKGPNYDWKVRNTDFYTSSMKNLSDYKLNMKSLRYKLKKGTFSGTNPQSVSYLKAYWTDTQILPGQTITRKNNWVWGKANTNTLTKTYAIDVNPIKDQSYGEVDLVFSEGKTGPVTLEVAFPLKFIR